MGLYNIKSQALDAHWWSAPSVGPACASGQCINTPQVLGGAEAPLRSMLANDLYIYKKQLVTPQTLRGGVVVDPAQHPRNSSGDPTGFKWQRASVGGVPQDNAFHTQSVSLDPQVLGGAEQTLSGVLADDRVRRAYLERTGKAAGDGAAAAEPVKQKPLDSDDCPICFDALSAKVRAWQRRRCSQLMMTACKVKPSPCNCSLAAHISWHAEGWAAAWHQRLHPLPLAECASARRR